MFYQNEQKIHAVVFRSGEWLVAQCLEYDIATQARGFKDLLYEIERILTAHVLVGKHEGTEPFTNLPKAPRRFWKMYQEASARIEPIREAERSANWHPSLELRAV